MGKVMFMKKGEVHTVPGGLPASSLAVGSTVYLLENGTAVEYLVVNQGIPSGSSLYDSSCNGTWLLRKDLYEESAWAGYYNYYSDSYAHENLNGDFLARFDEATQGAIKQVKIPTVNGNGSTGSVVSGSNGLTTKIFLLSCCEVGIPSSDTSIVPGDGAKLDYFEEDNTALRIAYIDGWATDWWLRSPQLENEANVYHIMDDGRYTSTAADDTRGMRPALIIDSSVVFDEETLILKGA